MLSVQKHDRVSVIHTLVYFMNSVMFLTDGELVKRNLLFCRHECTTLPVDTFIFCTRVLQHTAVEQTLYSVVLQCLTMFRLILNNAQRSCSLHPPSYPSKLTGSVLFIMQLFSGLWVRPQNTAPLFKVTIMLCDIFTHAVIVGVSVPGEYHVLI